MKLVIGALIAVVLAFVVFGLVHSSDDGSCRYRVPGGSATFDAPCGLDAAGLRSYVTQHPEVVAPRVPVLGAN